MSSLRNIALSLSLFIGSSSQSFSVELPNVVIVLADDLGYGDAGCYNSDSKIPTPNMDRIASRGWRFTDAHTPSSVCTPTRYTLLTGRYCWRTRLTSGVLDGFSPPLIENNRLTIASLLRDVGYSTACFGKWHLGMQWTKRDGSLETSDRAENGFRSGVDIDYTAKLSGGPCDVGFDTYFGISASLDMPPYCWIEQDRCVAVPDSVVDDFRGELFRSQSPGAGHSQFKIEDVLPTLKQRTIAHIDHHLTSRGTSPLFLYLPLNSPHLPVAPSLSFQGKSSVGAYGDFVIETDDFIGGVMDVFDKHSALENTIIIVTSDNGGLWHEWTPKAEDDAAYKPTPRAKFNSSHGHHSNAWLRGTKADIYEGGHRVTFLMQWLKQRSQAVVVDTPIELTDVLATIADVVSKKLPDDIEHDSYSFAPILGLKSLNAIERPAMVHHSINGTFAIRYENWKYVETRGSAGFSVPKSIKAKSGEPTDQLYDMSNDPAETKNVSAQHPEVSAKLRNALGSIRKTNKLADAKIEN